MPINDIQSSFSGGEYSPSIQARTDIQKYKSGLKTARNFIPTPLGPIQNRPGTKYICRAKFPNKESRLVQFSSSSGNSYALEFGNNYIRFIKDDVLIKKEIYDSEIPYWDFQYPYDTGEYVAKVLSGSVIGLYSSLIPNNINNDPVSPTYWNSIATFDQWNLSTNYSIGNYVYAYRPFDVKRKIFRSLTNSNINHDPFATSPWNHTPPPAWDSTTTYNIGDYVTDTDIYGNEYVYRCAHASNLNHSIYDGTWWTYYNFVITYNPLTSYSTGDYVTLFDSGGIFRCYQSAISSNVGNNPLATDTVYWEEIIQANIYELTTPYSEADIHNLKFSQSADTLYIAHNKYQPRKLLFNSSNDWTFSTFDFKNGPFMTQNTDTALGMNVNYTGPTGYTVYTETIPGPFLWSYFTDSHVGSLISLRQYYPQKSIISNNKSFGPKSSLICMDTWKLTTTGAWTGVIVVEKSFDNVTWTALQTYSSTNDTNFNVFGNESIGDGIPFYVRINITSPSTTGTLNWTFSSDAFYQTSIMKISTVHDTDRVYVTVENGVKPLQATVTTEWAEGSWSVKRGWPSVVGFFQDRLCFGSTPTEPQTFWASKSGNYVDYGVSTPLVDDDSIGINLLSRQLNNINSMVMFQNSALCFTDSSEWTITSEQGGAITPTSVFSKLQGYRGSSILDPILIGTHLLFISSRSSTLRDIEYQYVTDSLNSENISIYSEHLLKGYQIVSAAYQQEPDSLVWFVRDDGALLCLTYNREQEIISWSKHDTNGTFESVCSIPGDTSDDLYFIVKRGTNRFIEKMEQRTASTDPADQYFVDCGVSYSGVAISTLTGLDHLNGSLVAINAGGFVLPQQTVSEGSITLGGSYTKVQAGLPYISDIETLKKEIPLPNGTMQGIIYKINQVALRFLNSLGGYIGTDEDNLEPINQRDESLSSTTPTPLFTGFDNYTIPQNDDQHPTIFFRQLDPMPVTIMSITSVIEPGDGL